jgi:multiple sugar transport system ATP-binding protein
MTMGDRVAVMKDGRLQQVDTPQRLYDLPANIFVAGFIGTPPMNLLESTIATDGAVKLTLAGSELTVGEEALRAYPGLRGYRGGKVVVGVRARDLHPAAERPDLPTLSARVELVEALGGGSIAYFWIDALALAREEETVTDAEGEAQEAVGGTQPNLVAEFPPHATLRIGDTVPVAIDPARLHFFDESSGEPLRY